jgi:cytochrome c oxidase subunit II
MVFAWALILLVVITVVFHFAAPSLGWWFTDIASNWTTMDQTVNVTFWVTGFVFVVINLFMAWAVIRYRHRKERTDKAEYEPENKKLEWWLTIITSVGIAAMLAPGLAVWAKFVTPPDDASIVEVVGQQWAWTYRLPGRDGELGESDMRLVTLDNPLGVDPMDPKSGDDVIIESPELHIPLGKSVKFLLRAKDVNHQFAVPQFRVKMDMVPGMVTHFWLTPTRTGRFDALCEQLCGVAHFAMRGRVVVTPREEFDAWLAAMPTFGQTQAVAKADPAAGAGQYAVCTACHGPAGEGNPALNAPRLAGQDAWYIRRQLHAFRDGVRGAHEGDVFGAQMRAFASMLPDDTAIRNLSAYIESMQGHAAEASVTGNVDRGRRLYTTCGSCHGRAGEGLWALNAPRLADMSDWYMVRQLQNFQQGIRGAHAGDFYGWQMATLADSLKDERSINDVVAYINTLEPEPAQTAMADGRDD